jgi:Rps23 Pro-64 3,4-dihydroxylase Tpa1-like proline 4-hydroxylase
MTYCTIPDLLGAQGTIDLLEYAISNEASFALSTVGADRGVRDNVRKSRNLGDLGRFTELIEQSVAARIPQLIETLRLTPFEPSSYDIELVAHEDGAFYKRHIDLFTSIPNPTEDRLISVVCYLYRQPQAFTGGALRLFPQTNPAEVSDIGALDIAPQHGMAVAFSSWLPHEVRPVACPSGRFQDARFAINCWVLRRR